MSTTSIARPLCNNLVVSSNKGLLALSPELIIEITSHIVPWDELRSTRRNSNSISAWTKKSSATSGKTTLANLRLVCRYLGEVLQRETFKSITFNFHVTQSPEVDIGSLLASLAQDDSPAARYTKFLFIKCLNPIQEGYGYRPTGSYFSPRYAEYDEDMRAKAESITRSMDIHLERAILSFRNLHCIAWNITQLDVQSTRVMGALSCLPSIEDLALHIEFECKNPSGLHIDKFHGLRSLAVTFNNCPSYYNKSQQESLDHVVDHLSKVINHSPLLHHLSVLRSRSCDEYYDISFFKLTRNVSSKFALRNLESLRMGLLDLVQDNGAALQQLKALKSLHINGSALFPDSTFTGSEPWEALAAAKIELEYITVSYPSNGLVEYLASYSCLKGLHILLTYLPDEESMKCDTRSFLKNILPLHSLSLKVFPSPTDLSWFDPSIAEGLIFEAVDESHWHSSIAPSWYFRICIDSVPEALSFVLDCATQSPKCCTERLHISHSSTRRNYRCGTGQRQHTISRMDAERKWISDLEILDQDVRQYPPVIMIEHKEYDLVPMQDKEDLYGYQ